MSSLALSLALCGRFVNCKFASSTELRMADFAVSVTVALVPWVDSAGRHCPKLPKSPCSCLIRNSFPLEGMAATGWRLAPSSKVCPWNRPLPELQKRKPNENEKYTNSNATHDTIRRRRIYCEAPFSSTFFLFRDDTSPRSENDG